MRSVKEWIAKHDDQKVPEDVRLRIFNRAGGICPNCTLLIRGGQRWEVDHVVALVNGGEHRESNMQVLHLSCHKTKTRKDVSEKARVNRKRKAHLGIGKKKTSFRGWRKMDGTIVWNKDREK